MKTKVQRKLVASSIAFLVYAAAAMVVTPASPGQTRAQAAVEWQEMDAKCAAAKAGGAGLVARAAACMPPPLTRADTWIMLGLLGLGSITIGFAVAAKREN